MQPALDFGDEIGARRRQSLWAGMNRRAAFSAYRERAAEVFRSGAEGSIHDAAFCHFGIA
jgi:hypothetical protein